MTTIRRSMTVMAALLALLAAMVPNSSAQGHTPHQLSDAGWDCIIPTEGDNIHCAPPGGLQRVVDGEAETMTFKVFDADTEAYLGVEQIVHVDVYNEEQRCPTDPPSGRYTDLRDILGLPYWACHRYDSSF